VTAKLESLKTAAKGSDTQALRREMDEFNESLQKIGQHIYQQAGAPAAGASPDGAPEQGEPKKEEDVVDADYREVN
jgi:molecular chaperone DnaK